MHTWVIDQVPPLPNDPLIVQALRPEADLLTGGGIALNLGILARNGQIYRIARAFGLDDYNRAADALARLGLVPTGRSLRLHGVSLDEVYMDQAAPR
ncbi:MAG: hypothetical protein QE285_16675 [Aquabacterium sp.]|nr:hypothetical protein [Aquabacterium sp.]